jgi:hypothetical protein
MIYHWDKFYQYVTTPPEKPEAFIWPEDPLFCLACATTVHFIDSFTQSVYDPIAFKQRLLSSNRKSVRWPNGLSVLLKNKTRMIRPIGGKRLPHTSGNHERSPGWLGADDIGDVRRNARRGPDRADSPDIAGRGNWEHEAYTKEYSLEAATLIPLAIKAQKHQSDIFCEADARLMQDPDSFA